MRNSRIAEFFFVGDVKKVYRMKEADETTIEIAIYCDFLELPWMAIVNHIKNRILLRIIGLV